jgi:hypothetical protein
MNKEATNRYFLSDLALSETSMCELHCLYNFEFKINVFCYMSEFFRRHLTSPNRQQLLLRRNQTL